VIENPRQHVLAVAEKNHRLARGETPVGYGCRNNEVRRIGEREPGVEFLASHLGEVRGAVDPLQTPEELLGCAVEEIPAGLLGLVLVLPALLLREEPARRFNVITCGGEAAAVDVRFPGATEFRLGI